ncbi:MAG: hypothetical protein E7380_00785 [Clostridiales bacterium]|nr:hypothetical protein [Clostridiales bacterium]
MRLLKAVKTKWLAVIALIVTAVLIVSVFPISSSMKRNSALAEETETVTYKETDVEKIVFVQHTNPKNVVFLGFRLEESDYGDCIPWGCEFWEGDISTYLSEDVTYWKNFGQMNDQGVEFVQQYIYWNGFEVGPIMFEGTVAHRSTLDVLEFGFVIHIPAGTTFPSEAYVAGGLEGTPVMYKTTTDKAFYYNGTEFVEMPYTVAESRAAATDALNAIDLDLYYETEQAQISALIATVKTQIRQSVTQLAIDDVMDEFNKNLAKIMTKEGYAQLATKKTEAQAELDLFFAGFSSVDYEEAEWDKLLFIQTEGSRIIQETSTVSEVDDALVAIKLAASNVLTAEEKAGFVDYQENAAASLDEVCADEIYREEESTQREMLIQEGKIAIKAATSYDEVDALQALYASRINDLKTKGEWEEEEKNNQNGSSNGSNKPNKNQGSTTIIDETAEEEGCSGTIGGYGALFGVLVFAALVMIKKKKSEGERR